MKQLMCLLLVLASGATVYAGATGGPKSGTTVVLPFTTDVYKVAFQAGQIARVAISGDGDTDLDLYVYDENGNLIGEDDDASDDCLVSWVPRWTGKFTIKVVNRGGLANRYRIQTN